ncbi:MAG: hypothetical protein RQ751_11590 [Longimicrobiales bacterium]|nr:hypothetical protein [Longimicrobiales bacterium]
MCRLTAYAGTPLPLHALLFGGEHSLFRQSWAPREMRTGSVNVDGWGVAWPGGDGAAGGGGGSVLARLARVEPPWHDPDLPGVLASLSAARAMAVLRNATPGLPVDRAGLLPLVQGPWALALNGYVPGFRERHMRALRAPLVDRHYARLAGSSDAETLFLRVLQAMDEGAGPGEALCAVRDAVAARIDGGDYTPLTLVLLGPSGITALHTALNGPPNSLYLGRGTSLAPGGTLLASEALTPGEVGWDAVPPHTIVHVGAGGAVRVEAA